jgi:hypothetical protein
MTPKPPDNGHSAMESRQQKVGPLDLDHPLVGEPCYACHQPFVRGELVTLVTLGPGGDPEERRKARAGEAYHAVALPIHWACATGEE